jgi:hypothetical protein
VTLFLFLEYRVSRLAVSSSFATAAIITTLGWPRLSPEKRRFLAGLQELPETFLVSACQQNAVTSTTLFTTEPPSILARTSLVHGWILPHHRRSWTLPLPVSESSGAVIPSVPPLLEVEVLFEHMMRR